jgi:hypothetical protein
VVGTAGALICEGVLDLDRDALLKEVFRLEGFPNCFIFEVYELGWGWLIGNSMEVRELKWLRVCNLKGLRGFEL